MRDWPSKYPFPARTLHTVPIDGREATLWVQDYRFCLIRPQIRTCETNGQQPLPLWGRSNLGLLADSQSFIDADSQISHRALDLRVPSRADR